LFTLVAAGIAVGATVSYMQPAAEAPSVRPAMEILAQSRATPPIALPPEVEKVDVLAFFGDAEKTTDEADALEDMSRKLLDGNDETGGGNVGSYDSVEPAAGGADAVDSGLVLPDAGDRGATGDDGN